MIKFGLGAIRWLREGTGRTADVAGGLCASFPIDLLSTLCSESTAKNMNVHGTLSILTLAQFFAVYGTDRHVLVK